VKNTYNKEVAYETDNNIDSEASKSTDGTTTTENTE